MLQKEENNTSETLPNQNNINAVNNNPIKDNFVPNRNIENTENSDNNENKPQSEITELKTEKKKFNEFIEFIRDLIIILIIVMIIRTYFVAPFQISWSSMETNYHDKEFIIVNKFSYASLFSMYVGHPLRWDVVIFRPHASNWKEYYIKRVLALPWETIKFQDWEVFIKKVWDKKFIKLNETYLSPINKWKTFLPFDVKDTEFTVPTNEYFLTWDNRNNSSDSRSCFMSCSIWNSTHFIKRDDIIWKVLIDFWYFNIIWKDPATWDISGLGKLKWENKPRFFNTPKDWIYNELK